MEWVEVAAKTVAAAKELALDRLGVAEDDAEFEILDEPRNGFLGRLKGEARVRARVRPTQARQKLDRRDRKRGKDGKDGKESSSATDSNDAGEVGQGSDRPSRGGRSRQGGRSGQGGGRDRSSGRAPRDEVPNVNGERDETTDVGRQAAATGSQRSGGQRGNGSRPKHSEQSPTQSPTQQESIMSAEQVGEEAIRFMDGLVSAFGLSGTAELVNDGDDLEVRVHGDGLGLLVGPRGTTLQAVQDLARVAAQRRLGDHDTRLRVDVGGYRERRKEALSRFAMQMAAEVRESGVARVLEPMSSADRKVIHDALGDEAGVATRSEGEDPFRRIVIAPANG